jgi:Peptidase family S41
VVIHPQLRLTTTRYFTPSGRSIQAQGVTPDIEVLQDVPDNLKAQLDTQGEGRSAATPKARVPNRPARSSFKAEFLNAERRWLTLACSYGFTESLEDFTAANSERGRKFEERLQYSSARVPGVSKNLDGPGHTPTP